MGIGCDQSRTKWMSVTFGGIQMPGLTRTRQCETGDDSGQVLVRHASAIKTLARNINDRRKAGLDSETEISGPARGLPQQPPGMGT
jgi:hypothetical protein